VSNPLPSLLALTSIADGSQQQAAPIRNNYSAIQTAANALITALKGGTTGALLYATDANDIAYLPDAPTDKGVLVWSAALSRWMPSTKVLVDDSTGKVTLGASQLAGGAMRTTVSAISGGPPASPSDGDIWVATGVDANGTRWQFQYNAGSASAFKWEFIGGSRLRVTVAAYNYTGAANADQFNNTGLTLPRAGDYNYIIRFQAVNNSPGIANFHTQGAVGGAAAGNAQSIVTGIPNGANAVTFHHEDFANGLSASAVLQILTNASGQPFNVTSIIVEAWPQRIS